jgi:hypothetical protein
MLKVLIEYFKELEEESIRDNFVIIYELLDEMMDFGYPQTTESKILQEYGYVTSYSCGIADVPFAGTLHKSPTSWKFKSDRRSRSQTRFRGDQKVFGTGRTRYFWTLLRA